MVIDPSDVDAPDVAITDQSSDDAIITHIAECIGTANDDNLLFYTLSVAPMGSTTFTEIRPRYHDRGQRRAGHA